MYKFICAAFLAWLWAGVSIAQEDDRLGASLNGLLSIARQLSPELAAAALDAEAANAAIRGSDSLPDPEFQLESESNGFRGRPGTRTYWIGQEFPLGGKLGLKRTIANSESERMVAVREQTRLDLEARIKTVQAERFRWQATLGLLEDIHRDLKATEEIAGIVYRELRGRQADIIRAQVAVVNHVADQARAAAELKRLNVRLNLLLGRNSSESLAEPKGFADLPDLDSLIEPRLFDIARQRNFGLAAENASIRSGEAQVELAKKDWYPNVKLQWGLDEAQGRGITGYDAFLTVNLPLRTERRQGAISAETSKLGAARSRRDLAVQKLEAELSERLIIYRTTRDIEVLLSEQAIPRARAGEQSLRRAYQEGRGDLADVLTAQTQRRQTEIELFKTQAELRQIWAEIERLAGGDL